MRTRIYLVTFFALVRVASASAAVPQPSANVPACVFKNVLAFGASVTHGSPSMVPCFDFIIRRFEDYGTRFNTYERPADAPAAARPYGLSPVRYLVKHYAGSEGLKRVTYISKFITRSEGDLGSSRVKSMLIGKRRPLFDAASLIVGVDAFYWDAVWDTCGPALDETITNLITTSRDAGKVLILGTVPIEDARTVRIDSDRTGVDMWWPPNPACATRINALLHRHCTPANRCYVADLKGTVDRLLANEKLPLANDGTYGLYDMRPDGIHLSDKGSRYISQLMITALEASPISCR